MLVKFNLKMLRLHICESTTREKSADRLSSFLKGIRTQSFIIYNKMNTNQKPTANTVSSTKRTTLCRMRRLKNFCLSKLLCICPFFSKNISIKKQSIASTEISLQFLAPKAPLFGKNKAAISSTSSYPLFSCNEKPCTS